MIRTRFLKIGTIALLTGVPGCGSDAAIGTATPGNGSPTEIPELGISMDGLGATVSDCNNGSNVGGTGNYDATSKTMTMTLGGGSDVFSVVGTAVTVNGWSCYDEDGVALTTTNVKKMNITTAGTGDKLVFDLLPGSFGNIFSTTGGVTVTFASANDEFAVRGNTSANKMKIGETGGDVYVEVSGDTKADIKLEGTIPTNFTFLLGDGADTFEGIQVTSISATHIDSAATALAALSSAYTLTVYGGIGDDILRGGLGDDMLYGNAGADQFLSDIAADGDDKIWGGADTDTVSYVDRTANITADVAPLGISAEGSVALTGLTYPYTGDIDIAVDSNSDGLVTAADATLNLAAAAATDPGALAAALKADAQCPTALTISVDHNNHLLLSTSSTPFRVLSGQDEAALGLTTGVFSTRAGSNVTKGTVDLTGLTYPYTGDIDIRVDNNGDGAITNADTTLNLGAAAVADAAALAAALEADAQTPANMTFAVATGNLLQITYTASFDIKSGQDEAALGLVATRFLNFDLDGDDGDSAASEVDDIHNDVENIIGGAGDDILSGNSGSNSLTGGAGDDTLNGGVGGSTCTADVDVLTGGADDDTFKMGYASDCGDEVVGGAGADKVDYQYRSVALTITVDGTANDGVTSTENDNIKTDVEEILGGTAGDTITGGSGNETIHGGAGNDVINGGTGNDILIGNSGNDTLNGAAGDDIFYAAGDDNKFAVYTNVTTDDMGNGNDVMNGGTGTDKITYSGRTAALTVTMCTDSAAATGAGTGTGCADSDGGKVTVITGNVDMTGVLTINAADDLILLVDGTTRTVAFAGTESTAALRLAALNTGLNAYGVVASLDSSNYLVLTADAATLSVNAASDLDTIFGVTGSGTTTTEGDSVVNMEWLTASTGVDTITGGSAGETIEGGSGNDALAGGAGDDTLFGDPGNDTLNGDDGNDAIYGGTGDDQAIGGNGDADICEYVSASDTTAAPLTCESIN